MQIIADLHIHGKHSRGCSADLNIYNLEKYARLKGIGLLGTGDFTHPGWSKELDEVLIPDRSAKGIYRTKTGFPFIYQTEISLIYTQDGKGRKVHNIVLSPSREIALQVTEMLQKRGRVDYDGRPIFKISCPEFVEILKEIDRDIEIIPAHIWTPWFSMFGANSGFDSVKDCFRDKAREIHAVETGLSSDPPMNWRLSQLDDYSLVSFSDLHSFWPWRIGREATVFDMDLNYDSLIQALKTRKGLVGTIEVDPNYGKYHVDGHRACGVVMQPPESRKHNKICPVCRKELTIGVLHRVDELADRPEGFVPKDAKRFWSLVPLSEIISIVTGQALATKKVWSEYHNILKIGKDEIDILLNATQEQLYSVTSPKIARTILDIREGKVGYKPGYDGVYGVPVIEGIEVKEPVIPTSAPKKQKPLKKIGQTGLGDFCN